VEEALERMGLKRGIVKKGRSSRSWMGRDRDRDGSGSADGNVSGVERRKGWKELRLGLESRL
jgi:hypothetical protein